MKRNNKNHLLLTVLFFILHTGYSADAIFDLVLLQDPSALCLDGSPGAYYISRQGDPQKIYIYFQGGGWCGQSDLSSTLESCYQRSKTQLGSSSTYPKTKTFTQGILSLDDQNNFKNWTRVLLQYCDGSGHQGTNKNPIKYKDSTLYFRGHNITLEQFNLLEKYNKLFSEATHIVVSGGSAGGLAAYLWTNYVVDNAKKAKVWSVPDSGIFLDSLNINSKQPLYKIGLENIMKLSNIEIDPPAPECVNKFKNAKENCMFAQNIYQYIRAPVFHIQSLYDIWSIPNILGINCISGLTLANCNQTQRAQIEKYHQNVTNLLIQMGTIKTNGYWAPVCAYHGFASHTAYYNQNFRIPTGSQLSIAQSVKRWMNGVDENSQHIDMSEWPANKPCSGVQLNILENQMKYTQL